MVGVGWRVCDYNQSVCTATKPKLSPYRRRLLLLAILSVFSFIRVVGGRGGAAVVLLLEASNELGLVAARLQRQRLPAREKGKQTERSNAQSVTRRIASPPALYLATSLQFANFEVRELKQRPTDGGESLRESIQHSSALISFLCLRFSSASIMC